MSSRRWRGPGEWVLPATLVVAGIVALLANLGAISWSQVDRLGDLWALLVILLGMWLILGVVAGHRTRDLLMVVLVLVMAAAAVAYVAAGPAAVQPPST